MVTVPSVVNVVTTCHGSAAVPDPSNALWLEMPSWFAPTRPPVALPLNP